MNPSPSNASPGLKDIPPEIVHHVLNELRVFDILNLANCKEPSINHSILSHRVCGKVFHYDFEKLNSASDIVRFYADVCRSLRLRQPTTDFFLGLDILNLPTSLKRLRGGDWNKVEYPPVDHNTITEHIISRLDQSLNIKPWQREILAIYEPKNLPLMCDQSPFGDIKSRWEKIHASQKKINALKSDQLKRAAKLLQANPDILKRSTDSGQKRRPNLQHQISRMNATADKFSRLLLIRDGNHGGSYFRYKQFPVVPFDAPLDFVAESLEKHVMSSQLKHHASADGSDLNYAETAHEILSPILHHVKTLIGETIHKDSPGKAETPLEFEPERKAPAWVFRTPSFDVPIGDADERTQSGLQKPCFVHEQGLRQPDKPWNSQSMAWEPYDERELEWLEAFVEVYHYFDGLSKGVKSEG